MNGTILIIATYIIVAVLLVVIVIILNKNKKKMMRKKINNLDVIKNDVLSLPLLSEIEKVSSLTKGEQLEEKINNYKKVYEDLKTNSFKKIEDMILELDFLIQENPKEFYYKYSLIELELYRNRYLINHILEELKELTSYEDKYRGLIVKLKNKYRIINREYESNKDLYGVLTDTIDMQFENIEKRFQDFEESMEKNEYGEVVHIVKAIDNMVDHMSIVVEEVPDLVLLAEKLIPKRIEQITETYQDMIEKDYPIGYMNIEYNVEEALKNVNSIVDRIKVLNLEDCMFELRTMLEYLDSLFNEFEKEKTSRKEYEEESNVFNKKLEKVNKVVADIYGQLDEIKSMYDLTDEDIKVIDEVNNRLNDINEEYKKALIDLSKKEISYSKMLRILENLTLNLSKVDDDLDISLKSLGNMYEDEVRAREQLDEIQELLNQSKIRIRGYKLPIIGNEYFVQLSEANEAILEIIKELEKKPISIKTLNTRVDTARDLVLKLYNTTNEMIKTARLVEDAIIYGNRFRKDNKEIDRGLSKAEVLFYKGNYKKALEVSFETLDTYDTGIKVRLMHSYENEK